MDATMWLFVMSDDKPSFKPAIRCRSSKLSALGLGGVVAIFSLVVNYAFGFTGGICSTCETAKTLHKQLTLSQDAEFAPDGFSERVFSAQSLQLNPFFSATLSICSQK
jgi:hypothetical protein